ncbi:MAG: CheR family methyltransferase [Terriglobales bacterium]
MSISSFDFEYLRKLLAEQTAIVLDAGKEYIAESRLARLVEQEGFDSIQQLLQALRSNSFDGLQKRVVNAMTNNETWFFRDLLPFQALQKVVIPALLSARASERRLRIWCAACSTGQEPYSITMLLREHFPELSNWDVHLLATDISTSVLERAQRGHYSQLEINRGLPAPMLTRYFTRVGLDWVISDELRRRIDYRSFNLAEPWREFPSCDVIFVRNILIYFDVETKKQIFARIRRSLRPDGYMFLGGAETTLNLDNNFERVQYEKTAYYRLKA